MSRLLNTKFLAMLPFCLVAFVALLSLPLEAEEISSARAMVMTGLKAASKNIKTEKLQLNGLRPGSARLITINNSDKNNNK